MPTRIRGCLISTDGRTPISGVSMEAFDPATGAVQGATTTDANGQFILSGLEDRAWVARRAAASGTQMIQEAKETWVEEDIHGQRASLSAHGIGEIRGAAQVAFFDVAQTWTQIQTYSTALRFANDGTTADTMLLEDSAGWDLLKARKRTDMFSDATTGTQLQFGDVDVSTRRAVITGQGSTGAALDRFGISASKVLVADVGYNNASFVITANDLVHFINTASDSKVGCVVECTRSTLTADLHQWISVTANAQTTAIDKDATFAGAIRDTSRIQATADLSKKLAFDVSGLTTATTRTWTVKDWSGHVPVPVDSGTTGQVLTSQGSGTQPIWATAAGGTHDILSATHTDTLAAAVVRGDVIIGNATPKWSRLAVGAANRLLRSNGTDPSWAQVALATDVSGVLPEANGGTNQSTYALGDIIYSSATNTLAKLAGNITSTKNFLTQTGTGAVSAAPVWGTIAVADVPAHNVLSATHGDTLTGTVVRGDVIIGNSTPKWARLALGAANRVLRSDGTDPSWAQVALTTDVTGTLPIGNGGTGQTTAPAGSVIYGNAGGTAFVALTNGTVGQVLTSAGGTSAPSWATPSGGTTHEMLSSTHTDTLVGTVVRGDLIVGNSTPKWSRRALGAADTFLRSDGSDAIWAGLNASDLPAHDHSGTTQGGGTINVKDSTFTIYGSATSSKKLAFQVDTLSVGTRTWTAQDADGTVPLLETQQRFTRTQTFQTDDLLDEVPAKFIVGLSQTGNLVEFYDASVALQGYIDSLALLNVSQIKLLGAFVGTLQPATLSAGRTWTFPNVTGGVALASTSTLVFSQNYVVPVGSSINCNTGTGCSFRDSTTTTKQMRYDLTQIAASTTRSMTWTNADGVVLTDSNVIVDGNGDIVTHDDNVLIDMAA